MVYSCASEKYSRAAFVFFFQAEDGIRDADVTGVQTCALPIFLIATDAAREGVNLQGHCADLFHFDVPWNPARMEQRNGRIDRTLQSEPEVRCHYFYYPHRAEDIVLRKLVAKIETIQDELGSLGGVVIERLSDVMERGIGERTAGDLDTAEPSAERRD